ncbi:MAG: gliding motility-associated ABC transporter ATP-binding subunit GldA [Flavobacteriales bacterium]|nr:gliding motility-associated ABC transporter ATP-binding subunit GldA [Flavobacteriales bacterium]MDG1767463.1 gliding motility-associated ABC transporter ATP-binding subunit GldA [Flavobacteriales bacterium]
MSILVQNVTKLYGEQKALNSVDFSIQKGEIIGFLGPNGAGKTTMMKIITCFIPPSEGKVEVCGIDVMESPLEVKKKVGYLPEHNPLYLDMWVKEYLQFVAELYQLPKAKSKVDEMIERVGLGLEQHKKIAALSKGYRQRVGLAQAMIHDPEVLILDEPTSGLDPNQLVEIRQLIQEIGKSKTVMLSTHIMQEVEALCNRAIIINRGDIVADAPVEELRNLQQAQQEVVIVEFNQSCNEESLKAIDGVVGLEVRAGNTYVFSAEGGKDVRQAIFDWAVRNERSVLGIQRESMNMEEVFKSLTRKQA